VDAFTSARRYVKDTINTKIHGSLNQEAKVIEVTTPRKAIEFAVKTEEVGAQFYKQLAARFSDQAELKEVFDFLTQDEVAHGRQFRALLDQVPLDEGVSTGPEFEYLRAMSLSQFFMGEKGLKKKCSEIKNKSDAMGIAFELEKATLHYYQALREVLGQNDILDAVIKAEKAHLMKVMQYMITDAKFRGLAETQ
jgi:rubrerythrin